ncbi:2-oxoglutarate dehydrogenase E1 component [Sesbania bispinosa]|nr:2-oxoglutarate dehydrogenase E1 component [Sesbania bispinosa]
MRPTDGAISSGGDGWWCDLERWCGEKALRNAVMMGGGVEHGDDDVCGRDSGDAKGISRWTRFQSFFHPFSREYVRK